MAQLLQELVRLYPARQVNKTTMTRSRHNIVCLMIAMVTLMIALMSPRDGFCSMKAEIELAYVSRAVSDNNNHASDNMFTQQYSLFYDTSGKLVKGRLGKYKVSLGYEWLAVDYRVKPGAAPAENSSANNGRFLYSGELTIDPKEVPLRLTVYSDDYYRSTIDSAITTYQSGADASHFVNIPSHADANISSGTRMRNGATLIMGVKNGMTNGYNELLRHFPMLMLDYRDEINKSNGSANPQDSRLQRLAFVSLNKKDNWFHYRYVTYTDNISSRNNYVESQYQLGTVDHRLQRRWIDFTNWLTVSVDGQFTKRVSALSDDDFEEFAFNLFGSAQRRTWSMRSFSNFTRLNEINNREITYLTSLPLYATGVISPTSNWNSYIRYNDSHTDKGQYFKTASAAYNVDAYKKSLFSISHGLSVEHISPSDNATSLVLGGRIDTASTKQYSRNLLLKAGYDIRNYLYNTDMGSSSYLEQGLNGNAIYAITDKLRVSASQLFRLTDGKSRTVSSNITGAVTNSPQSDSLVTDTGVNSSSYQSVTSLSAVWTPLPRLVINASAKEDIIKGIQSGVKVTKRSVDSSVLYSSSKLSLSGGMTYTQSSGSDSVSPNLFSVSGGVGYVFNNSLNARVSVSYAKSLAGVNQGDALEVMQNCNYSYYVTNGITRKLFEINETFTSEDEIVLNSSSSSTTQRKSAVALGAKFFPLRQVMIAGGVNYSFVNKYENSILRYHGSLAMNYRLFDASLDYVYGKNKYENRIERKLTANVKKRF